MAYGVFEELEKLRKQQEAARSKYGNTTKRTVTPVPEDTDYGVFNELRKLQEVDQLREERRTALSSSFTSKKKDDDDDIAPVREDKQEEEEERTWFQKGAFEDGFSLKNLGKAILGSTEDVIGNVGTGIVGMGEKLVDSFAHLAPFYSQSQFYQNGGSFLSEDMQEKQNQAFEQGKKSAAEFVQKDLYDEEKIVKQIYSNNTISKQILGYDPNDLSVFGAKSDALAQSAGQLAATAALSSVGVPWYLTTGVTSYGGEVESALKQGATMEEAGVSGLITAGAEILTEKISGGIKFGGKTLDEGLTKIIARNISDKTVRTLVKIGFDAAGEGFEEVLSGAISAVGQKLTYDKEKDISLNELLFSEEAFESFIGGAVLGGGSSVIGAVKAAKNGVDSVTELTKNEQKVVDKEYKERIAEAEKQGKVSQRQKAEIYDRVLKDMEKGYISTDSIEAALGGETYNNYKSTESYEKNIQKEFVELVNKENRTPSEQQRYEELIDQVKDIKDKKLQDQIKGKLSDEVKNLVAGDRLFESYNEIERKKQAFQADLNQYDDNQKATVKAAMESGVLNNSNRAHDMVDMAAKVSSDTGVPVKFSDTKKMKEAGLYPKHTVDLKADGTKTEFDLGIKNLDENFKPVVKVGGIDVSNYKVDFKNGTITFENAPTADVSVTVEGTEIVNAVFANGEIVLNVKSPKYLETLTGHEITHKFEQMKSYDSLKSVLKSISEENGDWETRLKEKQDIYKGVKDADPEREVIADLVGEYIFEGSDYIMELSAKDRNVFEKLIDGIKHMLKMVTAGSQEARRLEQAKREFEKVYRELAEKNTAGGGVKYSLNSNAKTELHKALYDKSYKNEVLLRDETPAIMTSQKGVKNLPMAMNASHIRENVFTEAEAKAEGLRVDKHTHYHGLGEEFFLNVIDGLDNVKEAYRGTKNAADPSRRENYFLLVSEFTQNGNVVNVPVYVNEHAQFNRVFVDVNKISTVFGRDNFRDYIKKQVSDKNLVRIKNRSTQASEPSALIAKGYGEDASSAVTIKGKDGNVNTFSLSDSTGRQISQEQAEYFKDSKVRDENGNLKVMYHGTPNGDFTVFKDGTYFTDSKEYADRYQNPSASSISSGKTASNPKTFEVYLDIKKPFDLSDPEAKRIYIEDYIKGGNAMGINPYLSDAEYAKINTIDWTEGEDLRDFLTENGYDYDGLVLDEGADGGYGDEVKSRGTSYVVFSPEQVKNVDNGKPTSDPDIRFSLSEAVEETKELMAIHNLHSGELLKQLQMGGMPYPSVAITKPEMISHDNFGEVSIILNKDAIDPKKSKYNKVYSADAYTPTFPNVDYEASEEAVSRIAGTVNKWYNQLPDYYQRSVRSLRDYDNINDELNRWGGEQRYLEKYVDDDGLKQVYLAENGGAVPVEMKSTETRMTDYQMKLYQNVVDKMGEDVLKSFNEKGSYDKLGLARMAWLEKHGDALKDIYAEDWASDGTMTKAEALEIANEQNRLYWRDEIRRALEFIENGGVTVTETEDIAATKAKINERIANSDYSKWVENLFSGIEGRSGIRNNKDIFTPSGTRRSFAQTHDPLTIDNIVKAMRKENQTGQGAFGSGSILGASAKEFGSIAEIKRNAGNLGTMDKAEHDAITDRIQDTFWDISRRYAAGKDVIDAQATLAEAVSKSESKAGIAQYLKQYDYVYKYDESIVDEIIELRDYIRSLPTPYFEAKPRRGVGFDEVAVFVIPYDANVKLKQELLNRGYSIAEYDPNVEGDRQRVVNQFEEYKFSLADAGAPKQSGFRATLGKDVALEAPVAENATTVSNTESVAPVDVSKTETTTEDLFPDDTAPIQEEYERLLADRDDIVGAMDAYGAVGDYASAEQLMPEYEAVQTRIAEIEADDADRFASIDDADAPPEMDNTDPEDVADNVPLTKTLVTDLAKQVKAQLGLGNNRTAEVRDLIERYSNEEFPSKAHLYTEIQERFGKYTESEVDEELKNVKARLRTYGINVDEFIKAEIPDYAQMMRSNFGKVRFSKEGLPVDVAYAEFSEALPGYFPESIYVPTDQLMRIIEVANMDTTTETEYEIDWQTIEDVTDTIMNGVAEFKQNRKETLANRHGRESFQSLMESADQYVPPIAENVAPVRPRRPAIESVQADPDDIAPVYETSSGQQALMPEVEVPKTRAEQRRSKQESYTKMWEDMLGDTSTWKDMPIGLQYKTKTLRRILRKVVKDADGKADFEKADRIYDELETKYDHNEALLKRESQNLKEVFFKLNLNHVEDTYAHMLGELRHNPDTTLTEDVVKEYYEKHKGKINTGKVNKAIIEARKTFDDLIVRVNEVLKEQGMKEIPYRQGYFPHFTNPKQGWLAKLLNWKTIDTEIPTSIAGLTEAFKPQRSWQSFNKQRTGDTTDYSLYQGLDTYIHGALDWIYHIEDLQKRRALENHIRYTHSDEGVRERIQEINAGDYDADEAQAMINAVLDEADNPLSGLVRELMNRTNTLANKKSSMDRGAEDMTNRKIYSTMTNLNNRINANMVVGSFSSALTNFIPIVQSWHQVSPFYSVRGLAETVRSAVVDDGTIEKSDFLTNRLVEEESLYQTGWDKVTDKAAFMMNVIDNITAQTVWRSKYLQNIKEGMSENRAIKDADQFAKNVIGGRSRGSAPTVFDAKNPLAKLFTSFQLEVANQYGYMFEDVVQDSKNVARLVKGYATAFMGAYLYNSLYSSLVGRDAAFDPISIIEDLLKGLFDDDEEEDDLTDDLLAFGEDVVQQVPFVGGLLGGGRVPMSAAFPYSGDQTPFESMLNDLDERNVKKLAKEFLKPLYYLAMPVGGGQLKKTMEGLQMFDDDLPIAGSYTDSGNLRFPVEDTTGNRVQAALFGQWASENARDYFDNERKALNEKQTQEFIHSKMSIQDYWDYRDGLAKQENLGDKADYIDSLDLPLSTKNMLINNATNRKERIDMKNYSRYGSLEEMDFATKNPEKYDVAMLVGGYAAYMGYRAGMKNMTLAEKADYISKLNLTTAQKNILINSETDRKEPIDLTGYENFSSFEEFDYAKKNPEAYAFAKTVGGLDAYKEYSSALDDIEADKDKFGKSISGTRKTKVVAYINSLNIPVTQKYILLKSQYPSTDDYNYEIIDYVNSMDDMTFEEKIEVLRKLDFDVDAAGNIYW